MTTEREGPTIDEKTWDAIGTLRLYGLDKHAKQIEDALRMAYLEGYEQGCRDNY